LILSSGAPASRRIAALSIAGLIAVGAFWWTLNLFQVPAYGDTVEYWQLADTLNIDSWRTLAYPLILRFFAGGDDSTLSRIPVYLLQTAICLWSIYYLVATLDIAARFRSDPVRTVLLVAGIAALPLAAHFSLTILTDSLAASFFLLGIAAMARVFVMGRITVSSVSVLALGVVGSGLVRPERMFPFLVLLALFLLLAVIKRRRASGIVAIALIASIALTVALNRETQTADVGRPQMSVSFMMFDRTVHGRAERLLPAMPDEVKERMPREEAVAWDNDPNRLIVLGRAFDDPKGQAAMREGSWVAMQEEGPQIVIQAIGDTVEYILAPLNYARESAIHKPDPTHWTNTRMSGAFEHLTYAYIAYSILLMIVLIVLAIPHLGTTMRRGDVGRVTLLLVGAVLLLTMMYAGRTAYDFHIRYALPIYLIEMAFLLWVAFPGETDSLQES